MEVAVINLDCAYKPSLQTNPLSPFGITLNPSFQQALQINSPSIERATRTRSQKKANSSLPTFAEYDSGSNESDFGSQELGDDLPQPIRRENPERSGSRVPDSVPGCNCYYCTGLFLKEGPSTTW